MTEKCFCRLEIECQVVAKDQKDISGIVLESALYHIDSEDPSGSVLVKESTVGTSSNDHWVSVDTSAKANFKEAWYGGLITVSSSSSFLALKVCLHGSTHLHLTRHIFLCKRPLQYR